jgi:hypothetical protein
MGCNEYDAISFELVPADREAASLAFALTAGRRDMVEMDINGLYSRSGGGRSFMLGRGRCAVTLTD